MPGKRLRATSNNNDVAGGVVMVVKNGTATGRGLVIGFERMSGKGVIRTVCGLLD